MPGTNISIIGITTALLSAPHKSDARSYWLLRGGILAEVGSYAAPVPPGRVIWGGMLIRVCLRLQFTSTALRQGGLVRRRTTEQQAPAAPRVHGPNATAGGSNVKACAWWPRPYLWRHRRLYFWTALLIRACTTHDCVPWRNVT